MTNRKIEALQEAAAQKAKESAERVEKALEKMIKQGQIISFKSVAHSANVSTAYLYKQDDLRNRIETLRDQQKQRPKSKQPPTASDNSKSVIISTLREENKKLRAEIDGLRRINEGLAGRVYHLQGADDLAQRLKAENAELKQQLEECRQQVQQPMTAPRENSKVTSLERKRAGRSNISDQVKQQLESLGIQVNTTLTKTIKTASEKTVLDAIEALKEAISDGGVDKPGGWLKTAIEQGWKPNGKIQIKSELDLFTEWYPLAKQRKLVQASQTTKDGIMIYTNDEEWIFFSEMLAQYPLETL
jgi:tRNA nucleotidyltransferase/poly(A) polymerase